MIALWLLTMSCACWLVDYGLLPESCARSRSVTRLASLRRMVDGLMPRQFVVALRLRIGSVALSACCVTLCGLCARCSSARERRVAEEGAVSA